MAQTRKLRIVFMGTPHFAAAVLRKLLQWPHAEVVAVYTQPDRPAGRGHKTTSSAVKVLAQSHNLPVLQPLNFKNLQEQQELAAFAPDILAVAAYGLLLPDAVLSIPKLAPLNVHASLLPAYRGAAPIQRAIMDGCAESGVSIMRMVLRLDAGPVYMRESLPIAELSADDLHDALAEMGGRMLCAVLAQMLAGSAVAEAQDEARVSYAAKLSKQDGLIFWARPAEAVHAQIRGVTSRPGAQMQILFDAAPSGAAPAETALQPEVLSLTVMPGRIEAYSVDSQPMQAGEVHYDAQGLTITCADASYRLTEVRPQGRKNMSVRDFVNGRLRGFAHGRVGRVVYP